MKTNKLIFPLMMALAAVVATTGCKKSTLENTPLQDTAAVTAPEPPPGPQMPPPAPPINPGDQTVIPSNLGPGGIGTSTNWDPTLMNQDRTTLAADTVLFAYDSSTVESKEESKVALVSENLKVNLNEKLLIEGNCDERGTEEYNRSLGERRALALREELAKDGIDPERIRTISYGKDKPVDDGHNEAAYAKNRRGDFVICTPKAGM